MRSIRTLTTALALIAGAACTKAPAPTASPVRLAPPTTIVAEGALESTQAYCEAQLGALWVRYPKTAAMAEQSVAEECADMLAETGASSPLTVDALLATAESYYRVIG